MSNLDQLVNLLVSTCKCLPQASEIKQVCCESADTHALEVNILFDNDSRRGATVCTVDNGSAMDQLRQLFTIAHEARRESYRLNSGADIAEETMGILNGVLTNAFQQAHARNRGAEIAIHDATLNDLSKKIVAFQMCGNGT